MRVNICIAMAGEMFAAIGHACQGQSMVETFCEERDYARIMMKRAIPDDFGSTVIQIQHRRE